MSHAPECAVVTTVTPPPTLSDVAKAAGCGISTASTVLAGRTAYYTGTEINPAMVDRVKAAAERVGYRKLTNAERWAILHPEAARRPKLPRRAKCRPDDTDPDLIRSNGKYLGRCARYMGAEPDRAGRQPGHLYLDPEGDTDVYEYRGDIHSLPAAAELTVAP